ncbi:MAG: hypothetical protein ABSC93_32060 [Bryobacteraceae bacterium]
MNAARLRGIAYAALALCALLLCWKGVSWAPRPGFLLFNDEIGNLPWLVATPYRAILHILPLQVYNDRPVGDVLERLLYERFGFDYTRQVSCFLCFHFANCALVFLLMRRLGVGLALSLAGTGFFGSLSTTAMTATYIGASFDVLCTFFLLGSILAGLAKSWPYWYASALLFLLALRSKEFAIVVPLLLTILLLGREANAPWRRKAIMLARRLWLHYAILAMIGIKYLSFVPGMRASISPQHPYYLDTSLGTVWKSFVYYTPLIFTLEDRGTLTTVLLLALALVVVYSAALRGRRWILFGFAAYILTLLPVAMLRNIRQPLYVYGPQIFLILAICLFLDSLPAALPIAEPRRWVVSVGLAVALLAAAYAIRTSPYFRFRIGFYHGVRSTCARTARDAAAQLSGIGAGAHVYVSSGASTPWLLTAGPCDYLRLWRHDRALACFVMRPERELLDLYSRDSGAPGGKYFLDYSEDGSLRMRDNGDSYRKN